MSKIQPVVTRYRKTPSGKEKRTASSLYKDTTVTVHKYSEKETSPKKKSIVSVQFTDNHLLDFFPTLRHNSLDGDIAEISNEPNNILILKTMIDRWFVYPEKNLQILLLLLLLLFPHISPISRTRGHRRRLPFPYHRYIQKTQTKEEKERKKITDEKTSPDLIGGEGKK